MTTEGGKSVPVYSPQTFGDVEGLPPCEKGNCPDIIVSMLVGQKLRESGAWTGGVYGPDTGDGAVRAENGVIKGTRWLILYCEINGNVAYSNIMTSCFVTDKKI